MGLGGSLLVNAAALAAVPASSLPGCLLLLPLLMHFDKWYEESIRRLQ